MMKTVIWSVIFTLCLHGAAIHWRGDYIQALSEARAKDKALFILAVDPGVPACGKFLAIMRCHPQLARKINRLFVSVIVTHNNRSNYPNELYFSTTFPVIFIVDPSDEHFLVHPFAATPEAIRTNIDQTKRSQK
jgi:hypothetical protein